MTDEEREAGAGLEMKIPLAAMQMPASIPTVFVLRPPMPVSMETAERILLSWDRAWQRQGPRIPALIILEPGIGLQAMSDDQLRDLGLVRISSRRRGMTRKGRIVARHLSR